MARPIRFAVARARMGAAPMRVVRATVLISVALPAVAPLQRENRERSCARTALRSGPMSEHHPRPLAKGDRNETTNRRRHSQGAYREH